MRNLGRLAFFTLLIAASGLTWANQNPCENGLTSASNIDQFSNEDLQRVFFPTVYRVSADTKTWSLFFGLTNKSPGSKFTIAVFEALRKIGGSPLARVPEASVRQYLMKNGPWAPSTINLYFNVLRNNGIIETRGYPNNDNTLFIGKKGRLRIAILSGLLRVANTGHLSNYEKNQLRLEKELLDNPTKIEWAEVYKIRFRLFLITALREYSALGFAHSNGSFLESRFVEIYCKYTNEVPFSETALEKGLGELAKAGLISREAILQTEKSHWVKYSKPDIRIQLIDRE